MGIHLGIRIGILTRWLLLGEWRAHPVRAIVAIATIALGVALGFAIHLINAAAFNEFSAAIRSLSGLSDLQVRAVQTSFDERLYPLLALRPGVALASPVLELEAAVAGVNPAAPVFVVCRTLCFDRKRVIRLFYFPEFFWCIRRCILVRMEQGCFLPEGGFYLGQRGVALDA